MRENFTGTLFALDQNRPVDEVGSEAKTALLAMFGARTKPPFWRCSAQGQNRPFGDVRRKDKTAAFGGILGKLPQTPLSICRSKLSQEAPHKIAAQFFFEKGRDFKKLDIKAPP
ncbi:hypothetical protein [Magnetofaba australis]|uniref:hypothetical protein n=1 Tax=Magnetofaba australis TaxID=1472297 RepID=UPI000A19D771|nr:hypothetical protein [Magnetofaba australis]